MSLDDSRKAIRALDRVSVNPSSGQLLLQLLGYRRCRTAEPQDRLGERPEDYVHTRVLPVPLPPVGSEILAYQGIVVHGHRASMPPMNLVAPPDRIEIKRTGRCEFPDARCPEQTTIGDHHVRPCCARAVEITGRRDVCAPAGGEDLLAHEEVTAGRRLAVLHQVAEVGHQVERRSGETTPACASLRDAARGSNGLRVLIGGDRQELRQPSGLFIAQADRAHRAIHHPDRQADMLVVDVHGAFRRDELMLLSIAARTKHGVGLLASRIRESHEELGHLGCRGVRDPARRQSRAAGGTEAVFGLLRRCTRRTVHQVIVLRVVRQRNVENDSVRTFVVTSGRPADSNHAPIVPTVEHGSNAPDLGTHGGAPRLFGEQRSVTCGGQHRRRARSRAEHDR